MVNLQSVYVATVILGALATAVPIKITRSDGIVTSTLAERCVPDDPTSCGGGSVKRNTPTRCCLSDDPTSCDSVGFSQFATYEVLEKRCVPDDSTSCGAGSVKV
ncbi:hypothetical protein BBP40_002497 [Aspergillus hancockii]|nr:hypothetical protein BBP40_002497 [Aspergillus hancockii]